MEITRQTDEFERQSAVTGKSKLRSLCCQLMEAQENERRAVAYELHGQVGQELVIAKLLMDEALGSPKRDISSCLCEARTLLSDIIKRVKDLAFDLWPSMLDDLGLLPSLLWYFERFTASTKLQVDFKHQGLDRHLDAAVSTTTYRIVQGTLAAADSAGISEVIVRIWTDQNAIYMRVVGHGSRPLPVSPGLFGIRERAIALGGRLEIQSTPTGSTVVTAKLPLLDGSTKTKARRFGPHDKVGSKPEGAENKVVEHGDQKLALLPQMRRPVPATLGTGVLRLGDLAKPAG